MFRYAALNRELPKVIRDVYRSGSGVILDYAKENCDIHDASHVSKINMKMMTAVPGSMFALKPTSFGSRDSVHTAFSYTEKVIQHAINNNCKVCIDAEDVIYPKESFDMMLKFNKYEPCVYKTYQMYRINALKELETDLQLANKYGIFIGVKLVRGAYLRKQMGLFSNKGDVDKSFRDGLIMCLNSNEKVYTIVATQNKDDVKFARTCSHERYKIAQLMGMTNDFPDYVYVPFGSASELTPYLFRRFLERLKWS
jgi:hydroxyproline oxidase